MHVRNAYASNAVFLRPDSGDLLFAVFPLFQQEHDDGSNAEYFEGVYAR